MRSLLKKIAKLDCSILMFIDKYDNKYISKFFGKFTYLAEGGIYAIIIFLILFLIPSTRYNSYILGFAIGFNALLVNLVIKKIARRTRPFDLYNVNVCIPHPKDFSFPSGHTSITAAATVALIYIGIYYNLGLWFIILNCLFLIAMGFSRIYLKVHFLSDVLAGALIGIINGSIAIIFKGIICSLGERVFNLIISIFH